MTGRELTFRLWPNDKSASLGPAMLPTPTMPELRRLYGGLTASKDGEHIEMLIANYHRLSMLADMNTTGESFTAIRLDLMKHMQRHNVRFPKNRIPTEPIEKIVNPRELLIHYHHFIHAYYAAALDKEKKQ